MQGVELNGRRITVEFSKRDKPREPTPGKYLGKKFFIKVRNVLLQCAGRVTIGVRTLILGRTLGLRVVRISDTETAVRSDADTKSLVHVKRHTKGGGRVTPNHHADDLYTHANPN